MAFELVGPVSCDHHHDLRAGLLQRGHDPLGYGYGAHIHHGLEIPHPGGHARRRDHSSRYHAKFTPPFL
jgi:hypothetical protein